MDKNECSDLYSESETEEHKIGKRDLYEWISKQDGVSNAVLEGWIPETKQRPDIMFEYNGNTCVLEYQCSPIASEYIERHNLYSSAGINDIWICGTDKYLGVNKRLNVLEKVSGIYYDAKYKFIYNMEDISEKEIKYIEKVESYRGHLDTSYKRSKYLNRTCHVMMNAYDYLNGYKNYIYIKNNNNNYCCVGSYYPSPTGRPSRKYPYPVKEYNYIGNHSYATCYKIDNVKLKNLSGGKR